jgi:hypothetical protein
MATVNDFFKSIERVNAERLYVERISLNKYNRFIFKNLVFAIL